MAQNPNIIKIIFGALVFIFIFSAILDTVHSKNLNSNNRNNHHPNNNYNSNSNNNKDKVLLKDVQTLTLKSGEYTKARRTAPIKQIECIGGTAKREYELYPQTIQCYNMGTDYDSNDVQWRCDANLDTSVKLGKIDVSCEGYSYPDDPYITSGSCGVYYELEYTDYQRRIQAGSDELGWGGTLVWLAIIGFIIYVIMNHCGSPQSNHPDLNNGNNNNDDNFPYGHDQARDDYNGYPNLNNNQNNNNNNNNNNYGTGCGANNNNQNRNGYGAPGWGTAALAGVAGFFMGRGIGGRGRNYYSTPSSYRQGYSSSPSYRSSYSSGGRSGVSSSSSSHSGTSRR